MVGRFTALVFLLLATSPALAKWEVLEKEDPLTDHLEVVAYIDGVGGMLAVICTTADRDATVMFAPDRFIGSGTELRALSYRFDDETAVTTEWLHSPKGIVSPSARETTSFLAWLKASTRLFVRGTSFDGSRVDAEFELAGSYDAIGQAKRACGI